jgi:hypothetical protein
MRKIVLCVAVGFGVCSCTTAEVHKISASPGSRTPKVSVRPAVGELDEETLRWYRESGGDAKIAAGIERRLAQLPGSKTAGLHFKVTVVSFRLRSTKQQFWAGVLNGPDHITADIVGYRNGGRADTYRAHAVNNATMYAGLSASGRLEDMAEKLGDALADQL